MKLEARSKYRSDVDGLRGIAVLCVVGFHAFPTMVKGGFIGVDIFFVISGFLISGIIISGASEGNFSFLDFYGRRIRRIFPALVVVLACCMAYGSMNLLPHDYAQLGINAAAGAGFVSNLVLLSESGYFSALSDAKPLLHLWSLGIEEQYYIVWPVLLWILCQRRRWHALLLTIALSLVSFIWNIADASVDPTGAFYLPQTRFWELLTGAALAIYSRGKNVATNWSDVASVPDADAARPIVNDVAWTENGRSIVGILCIAAGLIYINETSEFPGWWASLPTLGTLLMISAGPRAWVNRRILSNALLVWFGLISFPLYLWHWPLLSMASLYYGEFPSRNARLMFVVVAIGLAWLTYQFVERPIRFSGNGGRKAIALLLSMAVVGYVGFRIYQSDGYPQRFPKVIQEIDAFESGYDHRSAWREGSCFLELSQSYMAFSTCNTALASSDKPIIVLWGDSLAAQLYPGYEAVYGEKYFVVQRTAAACAPIFGDNYNSGLSNCNAINDYVLKWISERRPHRVILAARWSVHDWKKVGSTIDRLHEMGVENIDLIGPVPRWKSSLPRQLILFLQSTRSNSIPERMDFGLEWNFRDIEPGLSNLAKEYKVNYLSPGSILCDQHGCMTRVGATANSITAFDYDHLSAAGSIFLVARLTADK
jgi:peptidoglycan/LPS O-acetylase OafA/YrhL